MLGIIWIHVEQDPSASIAEAELLDVELLADFQKSFS